MGHRSTALVAAVLLFVVSAQPKDKKLPSGEGSNAAVSLSANVLDSDTLKDLFSSDFDSAYAVIEVTLTPKGDKPLDVHLDDFLLRSEQTGNHSGPFAASQVAGGDALVVQRNEPKKSKTGWSGGFGGMMGGSMGPMPDISGNAKVEMKESDKKDPMLDTLKRKILTEKATSEPVSGLLFFPLEKEKSKHLVLIYTTPQGKIRVQFR